MALEELAKEFAANPKAANAKYKGKSFILEGEIIKKEMNEVGAAAVFLKGTDKTRIRCTFDASHKAQTEPLQVGQKIKVFGPWDPLNEYASGTGEVQLGLCELITGA
jgi:hypothetical protein